METGAFGCKFQDEIQPISTRMTDRWLTFVSTERKVNWRECRRVMMLLVSPPATRKAWLSPGPGIVA